MAVTDTSSKEFTKWMFPFRMKNDFWEWSFNMLRFFSCLIRLRVSLSKKEEIFQIMMVWCRKAWHFICQIRFFLQFHPQKTDSVLSSRSKLLLKFFFFMLSVKGVIFVTYAPDRITTKSLIKCNPQLPM